MQIEQQAIYTQLQRSEAELLDELDLYMPAIKGGRVCDYILPVVQQRLCVEWQWCVVCEQRRFDNEYNLALAVAAVLADRALNIPLDADIALIAALTVKRGLDTLCSCVE